MDNYDFSEVQNCYNLTAKQYSDTLSNELDGKPFDRDILKRFAQGLDQSKPCYELGAGSCHVSDFLYHNGLPNIIATDITEQSLDYARAKYPHLQISYLNMLQTELPNASVNGIICFYGIVHFTYKEISQAIAEWKRILAPKGQALFCFHVGNSESYRVESYFDNPNAKASWNFFEVDRVIQILRDHQLDYQEAIIRYPYTGKEHPSQRCFIQFANSPTS